MKFFLKTLTIFIVATILIDQPAFATVPSDEILDMYDTNGIYYYNPSGSNDACGSTSTTLSGSNTTEKMWNYFIDHGFTDAQAAGIIGNAYAESSIQPNRASNSTYWGMFQWKGDRKAKLFSMLEEAGLMQYTTEKYWAIGTDKLIPEDDFNKLLQITLDFTLSEDSRHWKEEIKQQNTPEAAAEVFLTLFERAVNGKDEILYYQPFLGLKYQGAVKRRNYARKVYDEYSGKGLSTTSSTGCDSYGTFTSLVKSYAWPEYHKAPFTDRMPGYAEAVSRSIAEKRYVGGSINGVPGIDCGGFVTILVQNSGLEPNYNDTKGGTDNQEVWVKKHNWIMLNSDYNTPVDTSLLRPGDVALSLGHTFIYVGEIPGFNSVIASASYGQSTARAPMAGREDLLRSSRSIVRWFRNPKYPSGLPAGLNTTLQETVSNENGN